MATVKLKKQIIGILLVLSAAVSTRAHAQTSEIERLLNDFEARAAAGTPIPDDEAEPVEERFEVANEETVAGALPAILRATGNPNVSVRRVAAMALWEITNRPDGQALLSTENATFAALLVDADIPIRRVSALAVANLRPNASSPLVPVLRAYLAREDAVSTIGAGVATVLMKAAPDDIDSTNAVVQFMRRQDQTSVSRNDMLQGIQFAKSHSHEIGKEVAVYADDPDEQTSVHAIATLGGMGKDVIVDNQQSLSRIAGDTSRPSSVRAAATTTLAAVQ